MSGEATSLAEAGPGLPTWVYDHTAPRVLSTPPWLAYVKISEGCDYTCSFCIIPTLRGRHRSRGVEDIVAEARGLAARGVREIVLVAQDSTRYGLDHGVRDGLAYLLRRLGRVDGIRWIRVMYAYPSTLTDAILDAIASEEKVVKYVDIPLQHASAPVLKRDEAAHRPREPPGHGRADPRACAGGRHPDVLHRRLPRGDGGGLREPPRLRREGAVRQRGRLHLLRRGGDELLRPVRARPRAGEGVAPAEAHGPAEADLLRRNRARVGERVEVLVEGSHPDSDLLLRGRLASQAPEIDGQVILNDGTAEPGCFVTCEVTEAHPYDLVARIL